MTIKELNKLVEQANDLLDTIKDNVDTTIGESVNDGEITQADHPSKGDVALVVYDDGSLQLKIVECNDEWVDDKNDLEWNEVELHDIEKEVNDDK